MRRLTSVLSLLSCWLMVLAARGQEDQPKKPRPLQNPKSRTAMTIEKTSFGKTKDGAEIQLFTCKNPAGLVLKVMSYGATVVSLETPDKLGNVRNIQLGFPKLDGYLARHPYFGSTVGRYGNRIAGGRFTLDAKEYTLATNNGPNHLHGGIKGFDAIVWQAEEVK